jgi:hypothetical protein
MRTIPSRARAPHRFNSLSIFHDVERDLGPQNLCCVAQRAVLRDEEIGTTLRNYVNISLIKWGYLFYTSSQTARFSFS